ncbi:Hypothetical predicted protein [Mytilus galloprovincialis]|uniref:Uncharacterized protein n=1 Tax=Mytilus galloprovincialis TaxID=29158 RepID=A0A8B6FZP9_MYTGA|nr:Hypothetical predicted protein [Mytilus galloprovincialis]
MDVQNMKYSEMQKLAKQVGIKANMKFARLKTALIEYYQQENKENSSTTPTLKEEQMMEKTEEEIAITVQTSPKNEEKIELLEEKPAIKGKRKAKSVHEEEKSFALGLQFVILRLFAYIPAPIMFGNTIDTSCLVWNTKCGNHGSCLLYDIVQFRYKYVGVSAGLKCLGAILFFSVWVLMYIRDKEDTGTITVRDIFNSVSSVERMDLDYDQRHYKHPKDKSEVKHSGDGESDKQFIEPDQWNRKLKYRHKSSEAGDVVPCEPTVFSSMLDTESTV